MRPLLLTLLAGGLLSPLPLGAESFASWSAKAENAVRARDYDAAAEDYTNALRLWNKRDGKKARARILAARAGVFERKEDWRLAVEDLSAALSLEPKDPSLFHRRGKARLNQGDSSKAIDDFNKAIALRLSFKEAYYDRARAYEAQGEAKFAKEDYRYSCKQGFKKACRPHEPEPSRAAAPAKPKKAKKAPPRPSYDFSTCLKLLDDCAEEGGSYEKCVDDVKVCGDDGALPCCPQACVKDYNRAMAAKTSQAQAYRDIFSPDSPCSKK